MRFKDSDFNTMMPHDWKRKKIDEGNEALEIKDRVNDQIKIWSLKPKTPQTTLMLDELRYLKEGKI